MQFNAIPGTQLPSQETKGASQKSALAGFGDYESFLKLFITQLRYQDPLSPASQDEFLAQTAQFTSVEQLMALNKKMGDFAVASKMAAASLIGRKVDGKTTDKDGAESRVSGLVAQLDYGQNGDLLLGLQDGTSLPLSGVESISQA